MSDFPKNLAYAAEPFANARIHSLFDKRMFVRMRTSLSPLPNNGTKVLLLLPPPLPE